MAKATPDAVLDVVLDDIAESDRLFVCSDQPANYAGIAAVALADVVLTPGDGNGDFTIANGDTNGRKLTVAAQSDFEVDTTGDADHIVLADVANTTLKYVTTCPSQTVTDGNTVSTAAFDIEIADPS
jgi:hypothetical protein